MELERGWGEAAVPVMKGRRGWAAELLSGGWVLHSRRHTWLHGRWGSTVGRASEDCAGACTK